MKYFAAQIKRTVRFLPFAVLVSVLISAVFALFATRFASMESSSEDNQMIRVGMVGDTSSTFLGFGIEFIKEADSSKMMLSLEPMSESEARTLLRNGEISAYINVPEGFVDSAAHGDVMQLEYVTTDVSGGVTTVFKEEILRAVSRMLVHSQKGIYAMQELALSHGLRDNYGKNTDELFLRYINLIIKRPSVLALDVRGVSDGVDFITYLLCGLCILCVSLFGIPFCGLFVRSDNSLNRLAASRGISVWKQTLAEFFAYFLALFTTLAIVVCSICLVGVISIASSLRLLAVCIPAIVLLGALQYLAFTVSDNIASAAILQFLGAVTLSYVCGCIYPISFFPEAVRSVGNVLPLGVARAHLISAVCGDVALADVAVILAYAVLLICGALLVNYRKISKER